MPRGTQDPHTRACAAPYRTLTVSGAAFQQLRMTHVWACVGPTTPTWPKPDWFGLPPVSLATTPGISVDFFSSGY